MKRASLGEDAAFRDLFDRYYARAVGVAYRMLGDRDQAEDIAMDAFARIYESRHGYSPQARFSTFLYKVVSNLCLNVARRQRIVRQEPLDETALSSSPDGDPARTAQATETRDAVRAAVLALPANQRMALILTRYEDMSYEAAAAVMGVSVRAMESLLHRAKSNLRRDLRGLVDTAD